MASPGRLLIRGGASAAACAPHDGAPRQHAPRRHPRREDQGHPKHARRGGRGLRCGAVCRRRRQARLHRRRRRARRQHHAHVRGVPPVVRQPAVGGRAHGHEGGCAAFRARCRSCVGKVARDRLRRWQRVAGDGCAVRRGGTRCRQGAERGQDGGACAVPLAGGLPRRRRRRGPPQRVRHAGAPPPILLAMCFGCEDTAEIATTAGTWSADPQVTRCYAAVLTTCAALRVSSMRA